MLKQYALRQGAWQASGYLLNYGAAQPDRKTFLQWRGCVREKSEPHLKALITHNEITDQVQITCLAYLSQDLNSFIHLIDRFWSYNEFYTAAFEDRRLRLAMTLFTCLGTTWISHYPAIFQHLCESSSLADAGRSTTTKVLSCIAFGLGTIVWQDRDVASKWYSAFRDVALRLDRVLIMPEQQLLGNPVLRFPPIQLFPTPTPFTDIFVTSMLPIPGYKFSPKLVRQHKIGYRLANCKRALYMWLEILQECGLDLLEYGRQEVQRLRDQENGWTFEISRDVWREAPSLYQGKPNGAFEVRLISFEYGRQLGDWKLWWSEPTDGLVGDFWKEMEPEQFHIPGSWDKDF